MNITQESTGELAATIKIHLTEADYIEKVNKSLKDYQRKANMPGFRPGKVPFSLVSKMYRKSAMADEINNILSDSLNKYLEDNKIQTLGFPIANEETQPELDFDEQKEFEFHFSIGIQPEFNLTLDESVTVDYYKIAADNETVEKYVTESQKRHGEQVETEEVAEGDVVYGNLVQLNNEGEVSEGGIEKENAVLSVEYIKDKSARDLFMGLRIGETITFNPMKAFESAFEVASLLGKKSNEIEGLESDFRFEVTKISHIGLAELNSDLYNKVYPGHEIETEEVFREKIREEVEVAYSNESDSKFLNDAVDKLIELANFNLPDEFMKRWMQYNSEKDGKGLSLEEIGSQYDNYKSGLKWQLIENKIVVENNLRVEIKEVRDRFKVMYGFPVDFEEFPQLTELIDKLMKNEEHVTRATHEIMDKKMIAFLKEKLNLNFKDISYEDFVTLVSSKQN